LARERQRTGASGGKSDSDRRHTAKIEANSNRVDSGHELDKSDGRCAVARGEVDVDGFAIGCVKA
jgi:hypothetical protein